MTAYKTYKIDLHPEDEAFLREQKKVNGSTLQFNLSEAVRLYVEHLKTKKK